jgi:hypothetical protein
MYCCMIILVTLAWQPRCLAPHVRFVGTPSIMSVHDYYPFAMEDGDRLAPMAVELVDRLPILVGVRRLLGMGVC